MGSPLREDEVEMRVAASVREAPAADEALARIDAVAPVRGDAGEEELRRQHSPARRLHLDVDVLRPARIEAGHDREQRVAAPRVRELVAAKAVAVVVVGAGGVALPEVDQRARAAGSGPDSENGEADPAARAPKAPTTDPKPASDTAPSDPPGAYEAKRQMSSYPPLRRPTAGPSSI